MKLRRVFFREFSFNRLSWPLLLNIWEKHGLDQAFDIRICTDPKELADFGPEDLICYSFMTPHLPLIAAELEALPRPGGLLICGGPQATGDPELTARIGFDFVFSGPAEETFLDFGRALESGSLAGLPALLPGRNVDFSAYLPVSRHLERLPPLELVRGCRHHCRFCQTGSIEPRSRNLDSVRSWLEILAARRARRVNFINPSGLELPGSESLGLQVDALPFILECCRELGLPQVEYGIFPSEIRPESLDPEKTDLLARFVSNRSLTIGLQSGLESRLADLGRGHGLQDVMEAVELANSRGFKVNLDLILALPEETRAERLENLDLLRQIKHRRAVRIQVHHFFPLAGSAFADRMPSFLEESEKNEWYELERSGLITGWWRSGELEAHAYLEWLAGSLPDVHRRFH